MQARRLREEDISDDRGGVVGYKGAGPFMIKGEGRALKLNLEQRALGRILYSYGP